MTDSPKRNQSPQEMFIRMADGHQPKFHFEDWSGDFDEWKAAARPEVMNCLGTFPETVDPNPELQVEWEDGIDILYKREMKGFEEQWPRPLECMPDDLFRDWTGPSYGIEEESPVSLVPERSGTLS